MYSQKSPKPWFHFAATSTFDLGLGSCLQLAYVRQVIHSRLTSWKATRHFVAGEQSREYSRNCSLLLATSLLTRARIAARVILSQEWKIEIVNGQKIETVKTTRWPLGMFLVGGSSRSYLNGWPRDVFTISIFLFPIILTFFSLLQQNVFWDKSCSC